MRIGLLADFADVWPLWSRVVASGETYMWAPGTPYADAEAAWMVPEPGAVYVAHEGDEVVATALLKPVQPGLGSHVANAAFMVDPDRGGRGYGRRLAEHVLDDARARGYTAMQFSAVVSTNEVAVRLWKSLGFAVVGTVPGAYRHASLGFVDTYVMHRAL